MGCRIPILLTIINFIIRSGGSFKPKIVPMFIDNATTRSQTAYGSSYRFLKDNRSRTKWEEMAYSQWSEEDTSSSDDETDSPDDSVYDDALSDFVPRDLPKTLFSESIESVLILTINHHTKCTMFLQSVEPQSICVSWDGVQC